MQTSIDFTSCVHRVEHSGTQDHLNENRIRFGKQCSQVYYHLMMFESITQSEAESLYGIKRLASRINDLKKILPTIGLTIESKMVKAGETKVAEYRIKQY